MVDHGYNGTQYYSFRYVNVDGFAGSAAIWYPGIDGFGQPFAASFRVTVSGSNLTTNAMIVKKVIGYR